MIYSPRFRLLPTTEHREALDWTRHIVRQVYNHALREFNQIPEHEGTLRQRVTKVHARMSNKKRDYKHKLAHFHTTEYDAVFVEDLDVKGMLESPSNARTKAEISWRDVITMLTHHGEKNGCHVVEVKSEGTTKECAACSIETKKTVVGSRPLVSGVRVRTRPGLERVVERPVSRSGTPRSGSLRRDARGDCDRCGCVSRICKSRRGNGKTAKIGRFSRCQGATLLEHPALREPAKQASRAR